MIAASQQNKFMVIHQKTDFSKISKNSKKIFKNYALKKRKEFNGKKSQ